MDKAAFERHLDRLARATGKARVELDDAVFTIRSRVWAAARRVPSDAEIVEALELGLAGEATMRGDL